MATRDVGRASEVVAWAEQLTDRAKRAWGVDHQFTLGNMRELATLYLCTGRSPEAVLLLEEVVRHSATKRGPDHYQTLRTVCYLAEAYEEAGNLAKAEAAGRELVSGRRRRLGNENPDTAAALVQLAQILLKEKKPAKAQSLLQESLSYFEKHQPNSWRRFYAMGLFGAVLVSERKYVEAEPMLLSAYQGMMERKERIAAPERARIRETLDRVIQLYEAWGKKDKAELWRGKQIPKPPALKPVQKS
jgi:tetratricopeptide (TPR) repeat protein